MNMAPQGFVNVGSPYVASSSEPIELPVAVADLRGLFGVFRRRAALVAVTAALIVAGGLGVYLLLPPRYEAKAQVLLDPQGLQVLQNDLTHGRRPLTLDRRRSRASCASSPRRTCSTR